MIPTIFATGLGFLALPAVVRRFGRCLPPRKWAVLTVGALLGGVLLVLASGLAASLPTILNAVGQPVLARSCDTILGSTFASDSPWALLALGLTASVLILGIRAVLRARRLAKRSWVEPTIGIRLRRGGTFEVVVLDAERPGALSVPGTRGRPGQVVLTTALLRELPDPEAALVRAHEEAHLRFSHNRYLCVASVVGQGLWFWPPTRSSCKALRMALERWADEAATGSSPQKRAHLRSALLAVAMQSDRSDLAAFSRLDGLSERLAAMSSPVQTKARWQAWPIIIPPGLLLSSLALYAVGREALCLI